MTGMCALAQLVAAPDSLYVCTGAHAIPLLWCKLFGFILIVWRQQPCKRVSTVCSPLLKTINWYLDAPPVLDHDAQEVLRKGLR